MAGTILTLSTFLAEEILQDCEEYDLCMDINTITACLLSKYRQDKYKSIQFFESVVPRQRFDQFRRFFRVSRETFEILCQNLGQCRELRKRQYQGGRDEVLLDKKVLMTLRYLASQETVFEISDRFGVTEWAFLKHKETIIDAINKYLVKKFINWPSDDQMDDIAYQFNDMGVRCFPGIIGAVDGTHIRIEPHVENPQAYFNRKKFHSVILQAVCRENMQFTSINVGWPGRVHDAKVLRNSDLWESGSEKCQSGQFHVLGDGAYPLRDWLLTPYRDTGNLSRQQINYNTCLSAKRQIIERAFGLLKGRFRRLKYINLTCIERVCKHIAASCVLHNICLLTEEEVEDFILAEDDIDVNLQPVFLGRNEEGVQKRITITNELAR